MVTNEREAHRQLTYIETLLRSSVPDAQLRVGLEQWARLLRTYLHERGVQFEVTLPEPEPDGGDGAASEQTRTGPATIPAFSLPCPSARVRGRSLASR